MKVLNCSRCGQYIGSKELRYIVGMHITLDVDGLMDVDVERTTQELARGLNGDSSLDECLMDIFTREMIFILCKCCRDSFVINPLNRTVETRCFDHGFVQ